MLNMQNFQLGVLADKCQGVCDVWNIAKIRVGGGICTLPIVTVQSPQVGAGHGFVKEPCAVGDVDFE